MVTYFCSRELFVKVGYFFWFYIFKDLHSNEYFPPFLWLATLNPSMFVQTSFRVKKKQINKNDFWLYSNLKFSKAKILSLILKDGGSKYLLKKKQQKKLSNLNRYWQQRVRRNSLLFLTPISGFAFYFLLLAFRQKDDFTKYMIWFTQKARRLDAQSLTHRKHIDIGRPHTLGNE